MNSSVNDDHVWVSGVSTIPAKVLLAPQWSTILMRPQHAMSEWFASVITEYLLIICCPIKITFNPFSGHG